MKARRVKKLDPAATLAESAARIVRVRLAELRSFAPQALEPDRVRDQHDMRIASKRLRYVLEMTEFCFGRPARTARRRARDLQDILGELHDCDVMLPRVETQIEDLRAADAAAVRERASGAVDLDPRIAAEAPNRASYRGLEVLAVYFEGRRGLLYERFLAFWAETERDGIWDDLERAVDDQLRHERALRRAKKHSERGRMELEARSAVPE
jgi:hypothetical protein